MAEQLQSLLDRIQQDGVDKANTEADRIIKDAQRKAARIVADAESKAEESRKQAERDEKRAAESGRRALEQAARDVLLSLNESINLTVQGLVRQDVGDALSTDAFAGILGEIVSTYAGKGDTARDISVLVSEEQRDAILGHVQAQLGDAAQKGIDIVSDGRVTRGFRVVIKKDNVEHDFSREAITETLCRLLRPHIAGIVQEATQSS